MSNDHPRRQLLLRWIGRAITAFFQGFWGGFKIAGAGSTPVAVHSNEMALILWAGLIGGLWGGIEAMAAHFQVDPLPNLFDLGNEVEKEKGTSNTPSA